MRNRKRKERKSHIDRDGGIERERCHDGSQLIASEYADRQRHGEDESGGGSCHGYGHGIWQWKEEPESPVQPVREDEYASEAQEAVYCPDILRG